MQTRFARDCLRSITRIVGSVCSHVCCGQPGTFGPSDSRTLRNFWSHSTTRRTTPIVAFLDRETAKIDALIAKKERLIELLQEKRTALISHAVTKGLDPTVPMKDSGVEWWARFRLIGKSSKQDGFLDLEMNLCGILRYPTSPASQKYGMLPQVKFVELQADELLQQLKRRLESLRHVKPNDLAFNRCECGKVRSVSRDFDGLVTSRLPGRTKPRQCRSLSTTSSSSSTPAFYIDVRSIRYFIRASVKDLRIVISLGSIQARCHR